MSDDIKFKIEMICHVVDQRPTGEPPKPAATLSAVDLLMQALTKNTKAQTQPAVSTQLPVNTQSSLMAISSVKKILIVHEDVYEQELIKGSLKSDADFKVEAAKSRLEAVEITKSMKPDVVVLDLYIGKDIGFEIFKEIERLNDGKIHFIVLSLPYNSFPRKVVAERRSIKLYDYLNGYSQLIERLKG